MKVSVAPAQAAANQLPLERRSPAAAVTAIGGAHELAGRWQRTARSARERLARNLAPILTRETEALAELMAKEIGKPVRFGRMEVARSVEMIGAIATRFATLPEAEPAPPARVIRRPHGVVAVITPWNNPIYLALGKILPAVLHGNTVVWKPAPQARSISRRLAECLSRAGWPYGLVSVLEGGRTEGLQLMNDERVAAVTITGSSAAGEAAHQTCCARRRIPLQAELGGNNAALIWTDADLPQAARLVAAGAFEQAGQHCTANRRVIVAESCRESFLQLLSGATAALPWGDPLLAETAIGPLVGFVERDRVAAAVEQAGSLDERTIWPQGRDVPPPAPQARAWYPPVIICCDEPSSPIVQEESFGPVLVVQTAHNWDHAIELCNGVRQGLVAAVFTGSRQIANRFLSEAQAGILKVNQSTADAGVDIPFGGWKASSMGPPEHGAFDLEFYTRPQTVYGDFASPD